jgi:hypothetical protein
MAHDGTRAPHFLYCCTFCPCEYYVAEGRIDRAGRYHTSSLASHGWGIVSLPAVSDVAPTDAAAIGGRPVRWWIGLLPALTFAVAASPIAVASLALIGDAWFPIGDFSSILFRVSQVGTPETPLIGAYTVKGWAHPGPLLFWLATPLYHLTGGDPRALLWTASIVNAGAVAGIAAVAWRRGRWPLLLGAMILVAVLAFGIGPELTANLWNPYLPLLPFLLTVFLVWDAALGRRRAVIEAAVPACLAAQSHLAFVSLVGLLTLWLLCWCIWWRKVVPLEAPGAEELPRPPWSPWLRSLWLGLLVVGVLWLAPVFDALFDIHNPLNIARALIHSPETVGPVEAVGLVGRYVRPDGPWMGGPEPAWFSSIQGSGPAPLVLALAVLLTCIRVGRRRQLSDVIALSTLALTLTVGAILAASQIVLPAYFYLTQWLKIVGGLVWFAAAWTGWRLAEPWVRSVRWREVAARTLAPLVLVGVAACSWSGASNYDLPGEPYSSAVQDLRAQLDAELPRDQAFRVEHRRDVHGIGPGVIYWLIHDGYEVLTTDGSAGLKWGHAHRWQVHEPYDQVLTVAINQANDQCASDRSARSIASFDGLSPDDRAWLNEVLLRRLAGRDAITAQEARRATRLQRQNLRIGVFAGPRPCADNPPNEVSRPPGDSIRPTVGLATLVLAVAATSFFLRRRVRS